MNQRRFDEAIGAYRRALELQPEFAAVHNSLGTACKEVGEFLLASSCPLLHAPRQNTDK
jgi:Flp pilus assembly protein TadD